MAYPRRYRNAIATNVLLEKTTKAKGAVLARKARLSLGLITNDLLEGAWAFLSKDKGRCWQDVVDRLQERVAPPGGAR